MISTIYSNRLNKLDDVGRFNGMKTIQPKETVSSHLFWVTFFCNLMYRELFISVVSKYVDNKDYYEMYNFIIRQALFSDVDEIFTGDVIFPTKYHNSVGTKIKDALHNIVKYELNALPPSTFQSEYNSVLNSDSGISGVTSLTTDQKTVCHCIIKLADWYSCFKFCYDEIQLGNNTMRVTLNLSIKNIEVCIDNLKLTLFETVIPHNAVCLDKWYADNDIYKKKFN